jgi:hypothetical protein
MKYIPFRDGGLRLEKQSSQQLPKVEEESEAWFVSSRTCSSVHSRLRAKVVLLLMKWSGVEDNAYGPRPTMLNYRQWYVEVLSILFSRNRYNSMYAID